MTKRDQRAAIDLRKRRSILGLAVAVAVVAAACSDVGDREGALTDAQRASTTIIELTPASTTPGSLGETSSETGSSSPPTPSASTGSTLPSPPSWPGLAFSLTTVATASQPTAMALRPGSNDLWLAERSGRVRQLVADTSAAADGLGFELASQPVIDITDRVTQEGEGGLLGLAFSGDGSLLYLSYTDNGGDTVIAEFPMVGDEAEADNERVLLSVDQPFSNHNGGDIATGPGGLLYISLGDGGGGGDPLLNGQDRSTLLGTILRIDPRPGEGTAYRVPADNPFVGSNDGFRPEIWLWGARNPWRFSFDTMTGDLWVADVGQNRFEEINRLPASGEGAGRGANLGWNLMEGNESFAGEEPPDHSPPIYAYEQRDGRCSVTGGYVYRGSAIPELDGVYLFGDFCASVLTGLFRGENGSVTIADLVLDAPVDNVISFGQGPSGEIYVLEQGGRVALLQSS